jgi:DNA-binding transcriptional LysR family regulator
VAAVPKLAVPTGRHAVLAVRPLVEPVVTRIMGIIRRHGATLSPAAQQFHQILKSRWAGA